MGQFTSLFQRSKQNVDLSEDNNADLLRDADAARDRRDWARAAELYEQVVSVDPSALDIMIQLGHMLKEMGEFDRAASCYYSVLEKRSHDDDLHLQIGHLEKRRGNIIEAREYYGKAVALNTANIDAQREYHALKRYADSQAPTPKVINSDPIDGTKPVPKRLDPGLTDSSGTKPTEKTGAIAVKISEFASHAAADRARDAQSWREAARLYQEYLERVPGHWEIWVQFGNCLKEGGDFARSASAYRQALMLEPGEADTHLQLGHLMKLQGRRREAMEAYLESFVLSPTLSAAKELEQLGVVLSDVMARLAPPARTPMIFLEISDLFSDLMDSRTISGIQRVQLGLIGHILGAHERGELRDCRLVVWHGKDLWALTDEALRRFGAARRAPDSDDFNVRGNWIEQTLDKSELIRPAQDDVLLSTGTIYRRSDDAKIDAQLKLAGVRLGGYIHDYIPLTHPEFCDRVLIEAFSKSVAVALLHYDFVLTVSEHVAKETLRLMQEASYPSVPVRAVPEAHGIFEDSAEAPDQWSSAIGALEGSEFVLCVGTLCTHKNQTLLIQIWRILLQEGFEPPALVLVGRRGHNANSILYTLSTSGNFDGRVHVFEGVTDSELATLYRNCLFTMFPSFVEGWGLPIGESLKYGKLCITSDAASMPEVGGDFALYIDPFNARGAANLVRQLLENRNELQRLEARIRSDFQPRTWDQHGAALIAAARELGRGSQPRESRTEPAAIRLGAAVHLGRFETDWQYGAHLPPYDAASRQLRHDEMIVLVEGWYPRESWGAWLKGQRARIGLATAPAPGDTLRVVLQLRAAPWARDNRLLIRSACGRSATVQVPNNRPGGTRFPHFLAQIDCVADRSGHIDLVLEVLGRVHDAWWEEPRSYCVGLMRVLCLGAAESDRFLPANQIIRPTALIGPTGATISPCSTSMIKLSLQYRGMLADGWCEPEPWGTRIAGTAASLRLITDAAAGEVVRVALQLRAEQGPNTEIVLRSACGASTVFRLCEGAAISEAQLWLECRVGNRGRIELSLELHSSSTAMGMPRPVGLIWIAYGRRNSTVDRLALAEALLFPDPPRQSEAVRAALEAGLRFSLIGHMNGSYSLAAVNRALALALEEAKPGTVRVEPVEGTPTHDLGRVPAPQRAAIIQLAARERHEEGPVIEIAQHWPIWVPPHPADLKLAWVPWEESLAPVAIVRLLNDQFDGVLVQTRFVAKVLIDSGLHIPIRLMGCAIDLKAFEAVGAERSAGTRHLSKQNPFVFLHISSCFPRKGVDALLKAYAQAFRRSDPVRLVIKGFPNPHNDVPKQIAQLRNIDPGAPEVVMLNQDVPTQELLKLYAAADAMVLPTRGEGFNMPAAEALAAGVPLIVTSYSGQVDFAGPHVARQVDYRFAPSRSHLQGFGSVWADPDVDDLAMAMREVFEAVGDPKAARELAARVERGRRAAVALGDAAAWARRVREISLGLLIDGDQKRSPAPRIAWVTTWNIRCGIATHSRYLLDAYPDAARDVTVLCDERTPVEELEVFGKPHARVAWRAGDPGIANQLASEIEASGARAVVLQHQQGLIRWNVLAELLTDRRLAARETIVTIHNLRDLALSEHHARVIKALAGASRVLVHSVRDLNLLKSWGLVDNAALLPPGALRPMVARHTARDLPHSAAPIIGTYGFFLPHKGFDALIKAVAALRTQWPGVRLRMVTAEFPAADSGAEIARCRDLVRSLGMEDAVEWHTDYLPDEGSLALLNGCDLLVLAHRDTPEAASGAARVAMASRAPVMATPVAIFEEFGEEVIHAGGFEPAALAESIAAALRNSKLRHETVDKADRWLEAHDWALMSERLFGMICGLVLNRKRKEREELDGVALSDIRVNDGDAALAVALEEIDETPAVVSLQSSGAGPHKAAGKRM